jgi:hypothetical protein
LQTLQEGDDVTDFLKICKAPTEEDQPSASSGGSFCLNVYNPPPKTEEPRVQNVGTTLLQELEGRPYRATLKIDGSSVTFALTGSTVVGFQLCVSSRNQMVTDEKSIYHRIAISHNIKKKLIWLNTIPVNNAKSIFARYSIQGEIYGPKVQKNLLEAKELSFAVFSIWDSFDCKYIDATVQTHLLHLIDLQEVPTLFEGECFNAKDMSPRKLLEMAKGFYPGTKNAREGFVLRSKTTWPNRISFKVINNDFK